MLATARRARRAGGLQLPLRRRCKHRLCRGTDVTPRHCCLHATGYSAHLRLIFIADIGRNELVRLGHDGRLHVVPAGRLLAATTFKLLLWRVLPSTDTPPRTHFCLSKVICKHIDVRVSSLIAGGLAVRGKVVMRVGISCHS